MANENESTIWSAAGPSGPESPVKSPVEVPILSAALDLRRMVALPTGLAYSPEAMSLYVIECPGFIKIGVSAKPEMRASELQIGNPYALKVAQSHSCGSRAAAFLAERSAHLFLSNWAAAGEWFALSAAEAEPLISRVCYHAVALTKLRDRAANLRDAEYEERYATDEAFRRAEDTRHAQWVTMSARRRYARELRNSRKAA